MNPVEKRIIEIIPANTCPPDMAELARRSEISSAFSTRVHLDICDNIFAPALSWPYRGAQWEELEQMAASDRKLPHADSVFYEAHLMAQEPLRIGELLARVGCTRVLAHIEVFPDAQSMRSAFAIWKYAGAREVGLALLIDTPLSALDPLAGEFDSVLLMSIATLGKQGAAFDRRIFGRIGELHARYPDLVIAVDGGVSRENVTQLAALGAMRFAAGSAISQAPDPAEAYAALLKAAGAR